MRTPGHSQTGYRVILRLSLGTYGPPPMAKILTQRAVDAAKPRAKRYGRPDGLIPGLQFIVQPSGFKSYALYARINGAQAKLQVGNASILTLAQARDQARQLLALIAQGQDPRTAKREALQPALETFATVARRFIERHAKPHTRGWRTTERILACDALPRWGRRPIAAITRADVIALLDSIVDRGSPIMANRTLAVVRKLFSWCVERGTLEHSPCERVKAPARENERDRTPSDAELARIWRAANELGYPFGSVIQLLILLGQRREEIAGMRWSELDNELALWTLPKERVKNRTAHVVPLPPAAREILRTIPRFSGSDFVFTTTGTKPVSGFSKAKQCLDAAISPPLPAWTLHDLRRSAASGMARLGVSLPVVEKVLNHVSGAFRGVAGIYQRHDFAQEKREALETWANHVLALVDPGYAGSQNAARRGGAIRAVQ
jgi:integrase